MFKKLVEIRQSVDETAALDVTGMREARYPLRCAQENLGQNSAAVHRAYAKNAAVVICLFEWGKAMLKCWCLSFRFVGNYRSPAANTERLAKSCSRLLPAPGISASEHYI